MDYYETLQVSPKAEPEVLEAAYRRLALKYHPDHNSSADATQRMREINAAYHVLREPGRRTAYDRSRTAEPGSRVSEPGDGEDDPPSNQRPSGTSEASAKATQDPSSSPPTDSTEMPPAYRRPKGIAKARVSTFLRWIAFAPASIGSVVAILMLWLILPIPSLVRQSEFLTDAVAGALMAAAFVYIGALTAPSHKSQVSWILMSVVALGAIAGFGFEIAFLAGSDFATITARAIVYSGTFAGAFISMLHLNRRHSVQSV